MVVNLAKQYLSNFDEMTCILKETTTTQLSSHIRSTYMMQKCKYNNENLQDMGSQHKESSSLKNDEPEVRDEISTPTFEYEIAYYTKDHSLIYQFKVKEESKKQNEETEQKKRIKQNEGTEQKKRIKQSEEKNRRKE